MRNALRLAGKAVDLLACVAVVAFNAVGMLLSLNVSFGGQHFGKSSPVIGVKYAVEMG